MEDGISELLAQRASLESGRGAALAGSLLLHAALAGVAVWAAWRASSERPVAVLNIRFAPMPPVVSAAPTPVPETPRKPEAKPRSVPPPHETKPAPPKPALSVPKSVPFSPYGRSTKKGADSASPAPIINAPPAPVPPAPAPAPSVPVGGSGVTALEGGDFPYPVYIDRMHGLIGGHWFRPTVTAGVTATIYFSIDRYGTVSGAKVEVSSGNGLFDRAALRAVLEVSPLPPLPFGYTGNYLGVHLAFK